MLIKNIFFWLLIILAIISVGGYFYYVQVINKPPAIAEADRSQIHIMPLPAKLKLKDELFPIEPGFGYRVMGSSDHRIVKGAERFIQRLSLITDTDIQPDNSPRMIIRCMVATVGPEQYAMEDESYELKITNEKIFIESKAPAGTLRAFETLLQLIESLEGKFFFRATKIQDSPRYPWRGLMLDVCRHWMPKAVILRNLDAMSAVKMNVFHWHLSDDEGFRVESKVFPKLHEIGSNGNYYTQKEIREIISYAYDRGIRILPEFDLPGHSKSWIMAYPELGSGNSPEYFGTKTGDTIPVIDPTKEEVYKFLDRFVGEMSELFPDPFFHIGGDEVNAIYWKQNGNIQNFMAENNISDEHALQAYFNQRMQKILSKHGKRMVGWDEILHPDLDKGIIVQSWRNHKSLFEAVQQGGTAILSAGYYLDHKLPAGEHYALDPDVIPGAVDIEPDPNHWNQYDIIIRVAGNILEGEMVIFDADPQNIFGFFGFLGDRVGFKNASLKDNQLSLTFSVQQGNVNFNATLGKDSIQGEMSLGFLSFPAEGIKSGGNDIPGTFLPEIEKIKPLTDEEKNRIIGGEACMWSEVVSSENVDSRIWPRTAAIAEKFWSPAGMTTNLDDMYRRLMFIDGHLTFYGVNHESYYALMLKKLVQSNDIGSLKTLVDVLEEVKYYDRFTYVFKDTIQNPEKILYLPDMVLEDVVDAAHPESYTAREFGNLVDGYLSENDPGSKDKIMAQLIKWQQNNELLNPLLDDNQRLAEIRPISLALSEIAGAGIEALDVMAKKHSLDPQRYLEIQSLMDEAARQKAALIIAVEPAIRKLVDAAR